jgi:hypothetical protein
MRLRRPRNSTLFSILIFLVSFAFWRRGYVGVTMTDAAQARHSCITSNAYLALLALTLSLLLAFKTFSYTPSSAPPSYYETESFAAAAAAVVLAAACTVGVWRRRRARAAARQATLFEWRGVDHRL